MQDLYLNHAGTSWPKPLAVAEAIRDAMSAAPASWPKRFHEAHHAIAEYFGVSQAKQIVLTPGCTSALAVGIGDALISKGKRMLTSRWEHHALHRPLLKRAASGIHLDYVPPKSCDLTEKIPAPIELDWMEGELRKGDVGLVAITAACNVTGELLPFDDIIDLAHRFDCLVMIDAAQVVGWIDLDFPKLGADMVAFGGHKGLQGPWGVGGLYVSEQARLECTTATCELPGSNSADIKKFLRPGYCDAGSVDQLALAGLHAAVQLRVHEDTDENLGKARGQILQIRQAIKSVEGMEVFGGSENGMPTVAFRVPGISSVEMASYFAEQHLLVGSGFQCAPLAHETLGTQATGLVRISVGIGQPDDEIGEAIERIQTVLHTKRVPGNDD